MNRKLVQRLWRLETPASVTAEASQTKDCLSPECYSGSISESCVDNRFSVRLIR